MLLQVMITPSGAYGSTLFLTGALTRVEKQPGEFLKAWIADPTGTFILSVGKREEKIMRDSRKRRYPCFRLGYRGVSDYPGP